MEEERRRDGKRKGGGGGEGGSPPTMLSGRKVANSPSTLQVTDGCDQELEPQMEALQHGEMVVVTAENSVAISGNALTLTSSGGASVSLRFKLNKRETQKQKLFKMFFVDLLRPH